MKIILLALLCLMANVNEAQAKDIIFGVVPQQSPKTLAATWGPLLERISADTGLHIKFATAKNIPTFEQRLAEGVYDIAYMNPYHYVVFAESPGYLPLVKQKDKTIKGIIVVEKSSPMQSLQDLKGKILAFPAPASFAASIIPQAVLKDMQIPIEKKYVYSHDSVYMNVARGFMPAGGGVMRTFNATNDNVKSKLRVLWTSKPYTPHAIAVHPSMSQETQTAIANALIKLNQDESAKSLLEGINFKGFEHASDDQWNDIRALGISNALAQ